MSHPLLKTRENREAVQKIVRAIQTRRDHVLAKYVDTIASQWKRADTGEPMTKKGIEFYILTKLENPLYWLSVKEKGNASSLAHAHIRDVTCERFDQYLTVIGYTPDEREGIFTKLHALNPAVRYPQ